MSRIRPELRDRITQYARTEPSFTAAFAAWELGCSAGIVASVAAKLEAEGKLVVIEPPAGPHGAVYRWRTKRERNRPAVKLAAQPITTPEREMIDRELAYTTQAPAES